MKNLKKISTIISIIIFACVTFLQAQNSLTYLPTPPHKHEVEIFLKGELPKDDYLRTTVLEVNTNQSESLNQLIIMLKAKAQGAGADGILLSDDLAQTGRRLVGIGIKYKKNINYVDSLKILKTIKFVSFDKKNPDDFVNFDMSGNIKSSSRIEANNLYHNLLEKYDFEFLVNDRSPNWHTEYRNQSNLIDRRTYYLNNNKKLNVLFGYEGNKLKELKVMGMFVDVLVGQFDAKGLPSQVTIYRNEKKHNRVNYTYDASGKTVIADWYNFIDGKEMPFVRVEYSYFSNADVKL